jgi:hypothetical protein
LSRECPCTPTCPDRSAICHTKGNCEHGYYEWYIEHEQELKAINKKKMIDAVKYTKAQETRHFNYIKNGQQNTKR